MSNEIITINDLNIDFKSAKLEFRNYEEIKKMIEEYVSKYDGLVATKDDKYGLTKSRSELIALEKKINDWERDILSVYDEPKDAFKKQTGTLKDLIEVPLTQARDGIKKIEEEEKEERQVALNELITDKIGDSGVSADDVEKDTRWLNKGNWTDDLKPKGKFEADVENAVEAVIKERDQKEANIKMLTEYCKAQDIDPAGWVEQLEYRSPTEIIDTIQAEQKRKEQEEKRKQEEEQRRLEREEKHKQQELEHEQKRLEQEELQKQADLEEQQRQQEIDAAEANRREQLRVDLEQEGTFQTFSPDAEPKEPEEPILTDVIEVTGTLEQLKRLNKFAGEIGVKVKEHKENDDFDFIGSIDDLPFN